ncbi:3-oxoadipate enol-lactonase [Psychrobacter faecalis]|uniref:3-oxoadipate enol-lactonase n=1 Tax=Psychrobacter faecalis TaxID=180588 RepID=UPI0028AAA43B|nr:3-oxoadipate enol-lactonase [Psychrobacter faecalis]
MNTHSITSHDGIELYCQTYGDQSKPALIFSNSLGTNLSMWRPQIEALRSSFFIITYDTRGHGKSGDITNQRWNLSDLGRDVISIIDFLEIKSASFCGISMGGITGQWLGIHEGKRFNKIIMSNTAAKIGNKEGWETRADKARTEGLDELAESAPSRWFSEKFIASNPDSIKILISQMKMGSAEGYANCCEALADADLRDQANQIKVSTLVIGGELDPITTVEDAKWLAEGIGRNAKFATITASHIANIEAEKIFTDLICTFLDN